MIPGIFLINILSCINLTESSYNVSSMLIIQVQNPMLKLGEIHSRHIKLIKIAEPQCFIYEIPIFVNNSNKVLDK